jgi:hypothetical protein
MTTSIKFAAINTTTPERLVFHFIPADAPLGHGREEVATLPTVVGESEGGQRCFVSAATLALLSGTCQFAATATFPAISKDDAVRLREWVRASLQAVPAASRSPGKINVGFLHSNGVRYAQIKTLRRDLSIRLEEGMSPADSLLASAAQWRSKALTLEAMATLAEDAVRVLAR